MPRIIKDLVYPELSYVICGLCFAIHNSLGRFLNEKQYADAFEKKLSEAKINYQRECRLPPSFEGERDGRNIVDFVVDDKIVIELKAKRIVSKEDYYQVKRYLAAADKHLGIIINFRQDVCISSDTYETFRHLEKSCKYTVK